MLQCEVSSYISDKIDKVICINSREHEHGAPTDNVLYAVIQKNFAFTVRVTVEVPESRVFIPSSALQWSSL